MENPTAFEPLASEPLMGSLYLHPQLGRVTLVSPHSETAWNARLQNGNSIPLRINNMGQIPAISVETFRETCH